MRARITLSASKAWALAALLSGVALGRQGSDPPESAGAPAVESAPPENTNPYRLGAQALAAFEKGEYAKAQELLERQLKAQPTNFVALYNLACCRSMLGDGSGSFDFLRRSVEAGFCDAFQMRRDVTLAAARADPRFKAMMEGWPEVLTAHRDANLERTEKIFSGKDYVNATDDRLRLVLRSALGEKGFGEARAEIARIADWTEASVIPGILGEAMRDDAWSLIILPTRRDFVKWITALYGPDAVRGNSMIGGAYEHDEKRLVSQDIGATMRHEFMHVLHWRSCVRLGQHHPIWIQEGLCSLVEDFEGEGAAIRPTASWRTNIAQRLDKIGRLLTIEQIASMPSLKFTGQRPLAHYAQARTIFLYLFETGNLKDWYADYTANFKDDATGVAAIERTLGKPIAEVNKHYRAWLRALPPVPEQIKAGSASLGLDVDSGQGEGPVVVSMERSARNMPDAKTALRRGDVITSIDGKQVRDIAELVRVLSTFKVGQEVDVEYRRVKRYDSTRVRLVPR